MDRLYAIHRLEKAKELLPEGKPRNVIDDTIIWIKQLPATSNYATVNQAPSLQGDALGVGELISCPFCHQEDFDLPGLKDHLNHCEEHENTEIIQGRLSY